jgi:DegV family protein with EDD domain
MTTLIVDSACDLPKSLIEKSNIRILPATIIYDQQSVQDFRDPEQTIGIYESGILEKGHESETAPTSVKEIIRILETAISSGENDLVIQTVNRVRSPTYENAVEAVSSIEKKHKNQDINIRVQDSRTIFTGQGVLAAHTVALINKGVSGTKLRRTIDLLSSKVHAYQVPKDVYYLRERGRKKGDNSVSWLGAVLGRALGVCPIVLALDDQTYPVTKIKGFEKAAETLFSHTVEKVKEGLLSPFVGISYAGKPKDLYTIPGFNELKEAAKARRYQLIISPMSLSGGVNLGPGTLSVAFATEPYLWEDK